jgi:two-component system response regulator YesN
MLVGLATDCKEAIEKVHSFRPDLIFMDIKLTGGDGLQLTKRIKAQHEKIVIIIVTNYNLPEYRQAIYKCGTSYFVSKSSSARDKIVSMVESIVSDKRYKKMGRSN